MSSRRSNLILVLLIVLALVGVALLAVPGSPFHRGVKKGLDLQGGLEVVLKAQPPKGHKLQKEDLDRPVEVLLRDLVALRRLRPEDDLEAALEVEALLHAAVERRPGHAEERHAHEGEEDQDDQDQV